jgi:hypothetical protein
MLVPGEWVDGLMEVGNEGGPGEDGEGVQGLAPVRQLLQHRLQELRHARQPLRQIRNYKKMRTNILVYGSRNYVTRSSPCVMYASLRKC